MSAAVSISPAKAGADTTPSVSPAAPAAVEFRYTQTDRFVELLHQLGASLLVSTYQANKLLAVRVEGNGLSTLVRTFDRPMGRRRRRPDRAGNAQGNLVPARRPGPCPARRTRRPARRLFPAAVRARDRRH